jgi:Helix-turn-helix domain
MNINKYRDVCGKRIRECGHPLITSARKLVLLRLVDYINSNDFTAWPAFDTLAEDLGVDRSTVIRAINAGRKAGLLERIYKGGKTRRGGTSNRYRFNLDLVAAEPPGQGVRNNDLVAREPSTQWHASTPPSGTPATQSSNDHLNDHYILEAPPSSPFGNDAVVAEGKKGVGEEGSDPPAWTTPSLVEIEYTPELRKLYQRAEEVYTPGPVPQRHWCKRKQTREEFDAEMAARGMNMDASRRRSEATAQWRGG